MPPCHTPPSQELDLFPPPRKVATPPEQWASIHSTSPPSRVKSVVLKYVSLNCCWHICIFGFCLKYLIAASISGDAVRLWRTSLSVSHKWKLWIIELLLLWGGEGKREEDVSFILDCQPDNGMHGWREKKPWKREFIRLYSICTNKANF